MTATPYVIKVIMLPAAEGGAGLEAWEAECERLSIQLARSLKAEDCTVKPAQREAGPGARSGGVPLFSELSIAAMNPSVLASAVGGVLGLLTGWVGRRRGSKCVIRTADGSEFHLEGLTKEEVIELLRSKYEEPGKQTQVSGGG